jgi:hypothetical protein
MAFVMRVCAVAVRAAGAIGHCVHVLASSAKIKSGGTSKASIAYTLHRVAPYLIALAAILAAVRTCLGMAIWH